MSNRNTLDVLSEEAAKLLLPLQKATDSPEQAVALLTALGWRLPAGVTDIGLSAVPIQNVIDRLKVVLDSTEAEQADDLLMISRYAALLQAVGECVRAIYDLMQALQALPGLAADFLQKTKIHEAFFLRLLDLLIMNYFEAYHYTGFTALTLLGIFRQTDQAEDAANYQAACLRHEIRYELIPKLVSDPAAVARDAYGWGTPQYDPQRLLGNLAAFFQSLGAWVTRRSLPPKAEEQLAGHPVPEAVSDPMPQADLSLIKNLVVDDLEVGISAFGLRPTSAGAGDGGLGFSPYARGAMEFTFPITDNLFFDLDTTFDLQGGVSLLMRPGQLDVRTDLLGQGSGTLAGSGRAVFTLRLGDDQGDPIRLFSIPGGSRVEAQKLFVSLGAGMNEDQTLDWLVETGLAGGKIILTASESDSFLKDVLPKDPIELQFDLLLGYSRRKGFYIQGGAGLVYTFRINQTLGPIFITDLELGFYINGEELKLTLGITGGVDISVLSATIQNIGLKATVVFGQQGNLGSADLQLGFKPPTGLALAIDASVVKGGGYLLFDPDKGEYAGALELTIQDVLIFTAIGILNTQFPDGREGYSLLIIITAQFPPITLGFGFFLNGLGGLLGLHRTMQVDNLRAGVQKNSLEGILFPKDVIKNIVKIISDLQEIFPPQKDQFVVGPMALITWSSPSIISVKLGLLIEFSNPVRLAILGVIKVVLPPGETPLVQIQVNFVGIIDFQKGMLSFDASLFDSFIGTSGLKFTLEGDMALRIFWGEQKDFVLSVGGFHPAFKPSASLKLPAMKRLTLSLLSGNPHLTLSTYFAITSNTVQFGAALDFYFSIASFKIVGYFGFDVLFQFSPFYFICNVEARLAVQCGDTVLFSIGLSFELQGPAPWRARGQAEFKILFFTYTAEFDKTFGDEKKILPPSVSILPLLLEALGNNRNWQSELADRAFTTVSFKKMPESPDVILMNPYGSLRVSQTVLPLDLEISLFAQAQPADIRLVGVAEIRMGQSLLSLEPVTDLFAPANFMTMADSDKLTAPSFVPLHSGVKARGSDLAAVNYGCHRDVLYEVMVSDTAPAASGAVVCRPVSQGLVGLAKSRFAPLVAGGALQQSPLSKANRIRRQALDGKRVQTQAEMFRVVFNQDCTPVDSAVMAGTRVEANQRLQAILQDRPELKDQVQIVADYQCVLR